jgi:LemA protein
MEVVDATIFGARRPAMLRCGPNHASRTALRELAAPPARTCVECSPMTTSEILAWAVAALLLFWVVGAYNRLMRLRGELLRRFAPIDEQCGQRHALLLQQIDALAPVLANAAPRLDALRAACQQVESARVHARTRPGKVDSISSLRLAEDILTEARSRLPVPTTASTALPELGTQLVAVDTALAFARRQFNEAVEAYNRAIVQFPTRVLAGLFGFRAGGTL